MSKNIEKTKITKKLHSVALKSIIELEEVKEKHKAILSE